MRGQTQTAGVGGNSDSRGGAPAGRGANRGRGDQGAVAQHSASTAQRCRSQLARRPHHRTTSQRSAAAGNQHRRAAARARCKQAGLRPPHRPPRWRRAVGTSALHRPCPARGSGPKPGTQWPPGSQASRRQHTHRPRGVQGLAALGRAPKQRAPAQTASRRTGNTGLPRHLAVGLRVAASNAAGKRAPSTQPLGAPRLAPQAPAAAQVPGGRARATGH